MCDLCNAKLGMKVALMTPTKLEKAEAEAFDNAIETHITALVASIMAVMWEDGIRDLDAMSGRLEQVVEKIFESGEPSKVIAQMFLTYSNKMRKATSALDEQIPF